MNFEYGRLDVVASLLQRDAEGNTEDPQSIFNLAAWLQIFAGRGGEAMRLYERVLALEEGHPQALFNKSALHYARKEWGECLQCYEQVLVADERNCDALNNMAQILLEVLGEERRAKELYEKALEINPKSTVALYGLGTPPPPVYA